MIPKSIVHNAQWIMLTNNKLIASIWYWFYKAKIYQVKLETSHNVVPLSNPYFIPCSKTFKQLRQNVYVIKIILLILEIYIWLKIIYLYFSEKLSIQMDLKNMKKRKIPRKEIQQNIWIHINRLRLQLAVINKKPNKDFHLHKNRLRSTDHWTPLNSGYCWHEPSQGNFKVQLDLHEFLWMKGITWNRWSFATNS